MEFVTLEAAAAHADRMAKLSGEARYVLHGLNMGRPIYWVCGPFAKSNLWPDRSPIYTAAA